MDCVFKLAEERIGGRRGIGGIVVVRGFEGLIRLGSESEETRVRGEVEAREVA